MTKCHNRNMQNTIRIYEKIANAYYLMGGMPVTVEALAEAVAARYPGTVGVERGLVELEETQEARRIDGGRWELLV